MSIQKTQNFTLISNPWKKLKKVHPEKVIFKKLLQISSIEEENFSQHFQNQRKILHCFDTHIQIL
jgi:hypothetical protein